MLFNIYCNAYLYPSLPIIDKFFHVAPSFEHWLKRYAPKARSTFIPLGFDSDRWAMVEYNKNETRNGVLSLVVVGLLQHQIDVMPVLQAIMNRDNIHLTLIGDNGYGERYHQVMSFIQEHKMRNALLGTELYNRSGGMRSEICRDCTRSQSMADLHETAKGLLMRASSAAVNMRRKGLYRNA